MNITFWRTHFGLLILLSGVVQASELLTPSALADSVISANPELDAVNAIYAARTAEASMQGRLADPQLMIGVAPQTLNQSVGPRASLKLSQALPWPGKRGLQHDAAVAEAEVSDYEAQQLARRLAFAAKSAWAEWWYLHQALDINQSTIDSYQLLVQASQTRYQNGAGRQQDMLQSQLRLLHAQHQQIELQQQKARTAIAINTLLNVEPSSVLSAPAQLPNTTTLPSKTAQEAALQAHPNFQQTEALVHKAELDIKLAKRERYPDFMAEVSYVGTLDPEEKRFQIGLGITVPFDQVKRKYGVERAMAMLSNAQSSQHQALAQLRQQLEQSISRRHEHQHIVHLYSGDLVDLALQSLAAAKQDYANGLGDFNSVTLAIIDYQQTAQKLSRHQANLFIVTAEIEALLGRPLNLLEQNNEQ